MIQKKKYAKAAKIIPDGYESANHFFEAVFKDKEMILVMNLQTTFLKLFLRIKK